MQQRYPIEMAAELLFHSFFLIFFFSFSHLQEQSQKIRFSSILLLPFHGAQVLPCRQTWGKAADEGMS